jgi:hypothetical protein
MRKAEWRGHIGMGRCVAVRTTLPPKAAVEFIFLSIIANGFKRAEGSQPTATLSPRAGMRQHPLRAGDVIRDTGVGVTRRKRGAPELSTLPPRLDAEGAALGWAGLGDDVGDALLM